MTETTAPQEVPSTDDEYDVRPELPVYECARCGRPFAREEWLALHRGLDHPGELNEAEVEAFREAHADEEAALRRFRLQALGVLVLLYFGLLMVYALV